MAYAPRPHKRAPPKLDLRAFQAPPAVPTRRTHPLSIVDSHIHLWTAKQLEEGDVKWPKGSGPVQLSGAHELKVYGDIIEEGVKAFASGKSRWGGVVYVQAEAEHDDGDLKGEKGGWQASLNGIESVASAALAQPEVNLLAIVPWAPVHLGSQVLSLYLDQVAHLPSLAALTSKLGKPPITSCRYLLQDSPRGFFLASAFIDGLREPGKRGIALDLTLDVRKEETGGVAVLDDAQEMMAKVHDGQKEGEETVFILVHHFAKPSLADAVFSTSSRLSTFQQSYIAALHSLSLLPHTYLKLSGFLDFAPPELLADAFAEFEAHATKGKNGSYATLKERVLAYLEPAIEAWGVDRILVGSDWPMFRPYLLPPTSTSPSDLSTTSLAAEAAAWTFEVQLHLDCVVQLGLEGADLDKLFAGNARRMYRV